MFMLLFCSLKLLSPILIIILNMVAYKTARSLNNCSAYFYQLSQVSISRRRTSLTTCELFRIHTLKGES